MRIGILGGTFNPIHKGHLRLAGAAKRKLKLDKVIFVPANIPPHKKDLDILPAKERYKMAGIAIKNKPSFDISDYEIKTGGTSYSIRTLEAFKKKFGKKTKLFFITGSDSLPQLKTWKDIGKFTKLAEFIVAARPGYKVAGAPGVKIIRIPTLNISSTIIRQRIKNGLSAKKLLSKEVYSYIIRKGFYKCT